MSAAWLACHQSKASGCFGSMSSTLIHEAVPVAMPISSPGHFSQSRVIAIRPDGKQTKLFQLHSGTARAPRKVSLCGQRPRPPNRGL
jgi:hypothetical protein